MGSVLGLRLAVLAVLLPVCIPSAAIFAQNCQVETSIPKNQKRLGSGTATADYDGITKVKGGQAVYVRIKNVNVLGVSYSLAIDEDAEPAIHNCTYKALLPPHASVIFSGSVFAEPPIDWKVTVAVGPESDSGTLTYEVYSKPQ